MKYQVLSSISLLIILKKKVGRSGWWLFPCTCSRSVRKGGSNVVLSSPDPRHKKINKNCDAILIFNQPELDIWEHKYQIVCILFYFIFYFSTKLKKITYYRYVYDIITFIYLFIEPKPGAPTYPIIHWSHLSLSFSHVTLSPLSLIKKNAFLYVYFMILTM